MIYIVSLEKLKIIQKYFQECVMARPYWQLLQQQGCDLQDAGMMQQQQQAPPSQAAISVQMPDGALPVASTKGFAWVLNDNCDRLQLLELVVTDGGGYYNPCG